MSLFKKGLRRFRTITHTKPEAVAVNVLNGYALWAKTYPAQAHNPLMLLEEQAMLKALPEVPGKTCLDLGCGSGRYIQILQQRNASTVIGLDYSSYMLAQAINPKSKIQNPKLVRNPFITLPFANETFDLITCGLAVGHEKNLKQILAEVGRVLRPSGSIIYSDFHPFAALAGWKRSFKAENGKMYQLEHYIHFYSDHFQACQTAGLTIDMVIEPASPDYTPSGFEQMPVVLVIRAKKAS